MTGTHARTHTHTPNIQVKGGLAGERMETRRTGKGTITGNGGIGPKYILYVPKNVKEKTVNQGCEWSW